MKSAAVNILIHVFSSVYTYIHKNTHISMGYKPRCRIAESLDIGMFSLGRYCHELFKVVVIIYTLAQYMGILVTLSLPTFEFFSLFHFAIPSYKCVVVLHHSF